MSQALLGFDRNLTHLDGHIVRLNRKGVTQPGVLGVLIITKSLSEWSTGTDEKM